MDISNLSKKRIKNLIEKGEREDKRKLDEYREVEIQTGISKNAEGSARVKLGDTEVIAGVKLGVGEPYPDHEDEGTMVTTMELTPLSSPEFDYGPPKIDAIEIARIVDRGIRESGFFDWKKLCIKEGEKVWTVFIDIYSINDAGNLLDASAFAAVAALLDAKFPKYNEKEERIEFGVFTTKKLPLSKKIPITLTFHKIGNKIILDPTSNEEKTSEARISIALSYNEKKEIKVNAMQKGNEASFSEKEVEDILSNVEKIFKDIYPKIIKEK